MTHSTEFIILFMTNIFAVHSERDNIVLHDLYQVDEITIEIEKWKQKVAGRQLY